MNNQFSIKDKTVYLCRQEVITLENNPYILIEQSKHVDMRNPDIFILNHIKGDKFTHLDVNTSSVIDSEEDNQSGHTCDNCEKQKNTRTISGISLYSTHTNVISDDEDDPTEARNTTIILCQNCINQIESEYTKILNKESTDVLSQII